MSPTDKVKKAIFYPFTRTQEENPETGIFPTIDLIPEWYKNAKKFTEDSKVATFKACISFFDALSFGYSFVFPSDLEVTVENDIPSFKIDDKYKDNFQQREPMKHFAVPEGYYQHHFAFIPEWAIQLPKGYSALYLSPLNRFDLPFIMTSGIIENDQFFSPGAMPFFIRKGFSGVIPKGTPLAQIIPFKRDHWEAETRFIDPVTKSYINSIDSQDFRGRKSGGYRDKYWVPKVNK